jgi:ATP-dependent Zn protease
VTTSRELESKRSAVHEAGHAAVCLYFGARFDCATIRDTPEYDGEVLPVFTEDERSADKSKIAQIAQEQIVIAYAGAESQRVFHPEQPEPEILAGSECDRRKIRYIADECGVSKAEIEQAKVEAMSLVRELRPAISAIADALLQRETLSYAEVKEIYRAHRRNHADC